MIAIVDYGAGNISSVTKALGSLGAEAEVTTDPEVIAAAAKVIVPGVGHFSRCVSLNQRLRQQMLEGIAAGKPFLGICVGMQLLASVGRELLGVSDGGCGHRVLPAQVWRQRPPIPLRPDSRRPW